MNTKIKDQKQKDIRSELSTSYTLQETTTSKNLKSIINAKEQKTNSFNGSCRDTLQTERRYCI